MPIPILMMGRIITSGGVDGGVNMFGSETGEVLAGDAASEWKGLEWSMERHGPERNLLAHLVEAATKLDGHLHEEFGAEAGDVT